MMPQKLDIYRRILIPATLCLSLILAVGGCGSDSENNDNDGSSRTNNLGIPCAAGESRFYCVETTTSFTGLPPSTTYEVIDACDDIEDMDLGSECPITWSGNVFSIQCSMTDTESGCTTTTVVDISGSFSDTEYTMSGTMDVTMTGNCAFPISGTLTLDSTGTPVDSATAACGPGPRFKGTDGEQIPDEITWLARQKIRAIRGWVAEQHKATDWNITAP